VLAPHSPGVFWKVAGAPYRALALRLYSRLKDSSPVLGAGIGAPLLRLWAFAALDPAAAGGRRDKGGGDGTAGIRRARARLTKAVRKHPKLAAALPPPASSSSAVVAGGEVTMPDPGFAVGVAQAEFSLLIA
jgi:hypothetical protein